MVLWSKENVLMLINDYARNKPLWNWFDLQYSNKRFRMKIIRDLARKYNTDVLKLKNKLNSLRSSFFKEHKRIKNMIAAKIPFKPWYAYEALRFLKHYKTRAPFSKTQLSIIRHHAIVPHFAKKSAFNNEPEAAVKSILNLKETSHQHQKNTDHIMEPECVIDEYVNTDLANDHSNQEEAVVGEQEKENSDQGGNDTDRNDVPEHEAINNEINEEDVEVAMLTENADNVNQETQTAEELPKVKERKRRNENSSFAEK
uniref:MADF domain-containing protein n=1 Tax=Rhodnius prolixus TaxID=13249 RepID=T1HNU4_RHOPR